jgi:N-acyl-D-aspartate/D-glutamate deacylase
MVHRNKLMRVHATTRPENKSLEGRLISELAAETETHPVDYFLDLALEEDLETRFIFKGMMNGDPAAVEEIIKSPYCLPGVSDAGAHLDMDCGVDFIALFLRHWVGEVGIMPFEEAIRRLTSMPANVLGLTDRGTLTNGKAADVVMFEADRLEALPREMLPDLPGGAERIIQRAQGVKAVIVNGQIVIEDGEHTGSWPGRILPGPISN